MRPRWLADALSGKLPLARAFWIYGVGVSVVYYLSGLLIDIHSPLGVGVYLLIGAALGVLQTIILWRCANNSRSRLLGRLLRIGMVLGLVMAAVMIYVLLTNSGLLLPPNNRWRGP